MQTLAGDGGATLRASEAQLRSSPDGKSLGALWMQSNAAVTATDVVFRSGVEVTVPDPVEPNTSSGGGGCTTAKGQQPVDPGLPALVVSGLIGMALRRRLSRH